MNNTFPNNNNNNNQWDMKMTVIPNVAVTLGKVPNG